MKREICICDVEKEYAYSLMNVINQHKSHPFTIRAFSSPESLEEYMEDHTVEVLLISPEFFTEQIRKRSIPHVFLLGGGKRPGAFALPQINKYQRVDRIMQQILEQIGTDGTITGDSSEAKVVAVYSPLHRIGKTSFALALGQVLGREKKVLYINLEDFSGFSSIFAREYDSDITDLLYYARQNQNNFPVHLTMTVQSFQMMDYIPPARVPLELKAIQLDEWQTFLEQVKDSGFYDVLILDFGDGIQGLLELLTACDVIYTPTADDFLSRSKLDHYEEMLEIMDYSEILAHTRKVSLPDPGMLQESNSYLSEYLWGPMAGYARTLIEGEYA